MDSPNSMVIPARGLTKRYGSTLALDGLDLSTPVAMLAVAAPAANAGVELFVRRDLRSD